MTQREDVTSEDVKRVSALAETTPRYGGGALRGGGVMPVNPCVLGSCAVIRVSEEPTPAAIDASGMVDRELRRRTNHGLAAAMKHDFRSGNTRHFRETRSRE